MNIPFTKILFLALSVLCVIVSFIAWCLKSPHAMYFAVLGATLAIQALSGS